ncbi:MAG: SH3 domain-containing protein [bacterium]|nr:SH3 domain-containing protein [bacterium]
MNLRTGPSGMYGVSSVFYRGDILTILGKTIGDEWIYIKAHDGRIGWMFPGDVFVHINRSLDAVPILDTPDSFVITGAVYHADGSPAEDINIITTTIVDRKSEQTESHSDKFGTFYAFIPKNIGGTYSVGVGGIPCIKKGERFDCRIADGAIRPNPVELTLPQMEPIVFHLQMK